MAEELDRCSRDICHWVNNWCWTYDPRTGFSTGVTTLPFDLFPRQEEFLCWLNERERAPEDGLVEKSRDMGVTWLCCAYMLHSWLFRQGFMGGFGSRKLDLVDKIGSPDCIFEKLRFLLRSLPEWMRPRGFNRNRDDCYTKLINPDNGSTIIGEGGDGIGRGGRATIYMMDEAAFLEHPELAESSLAGNTDCRIDISTPNGMGNVFYEKRHGGRVKVFTFHWRQDPRKDDAWYARQKARLLPRVLAQEVDLDYGASVEGITIPSAWVRAAVDLKLLPDGELFQQKTVVGMDVGGEGSDLTVLLPRSGPVVGMPLSWSGCNTVETSHRAIKAASDMGAVKVNYDVCGIGAGIKGVWDTLEFPLGFESYPVNSGDSASDRLWPDGRRSKVMFINLRAELWWLLRCRFERTYEYVVKGEKHDPEDMISIPNHPQLISEISMPLYDYTNKGRIQIESKRDMRRRGVKSPDFADALCLAFYEPILKKFTWY